MVKRKALALLVGEGWATEQIETDVDLETDITEGEDRENLGYYVYKNTQQIKRDFTRKEPLSGLWVGEGAGVLITRQKEIVQLTVVQDSAITIEGMCYFEWNLDVTDKLWDGRRGATPCLFLQNQLMDNAQEARTYTVVRNDWTMIDENKSFKQFGTT
jgi:hypothetical protein